MRRLILLDFVHSRLADDLRPEGVVKAQKELHSRLTKEIDTVTNWKVEKN